MRVCMASQLCKQCVQFGHQQDNQAYIDIIWDLMVLPLSHTPFLSLSLSDGCICYKERIQISIKHFCCTF